LKQSVKLDNPSDWQMLVELTAQEKAARNAAESDKAHTESSEHASILCMAHHCGTVLLDFPSANQTSATALDSQQKQAAAGK